jgi:uncharacterized protein YwlG (UPF0340 family)
MERAYRTATGMQVGDTSVGMHLQSIREDSCHSSPSCPGAAGRSV